MTSKIAFYLFFLLTLFFIVSCNESVHDNTRSGSIFNRDSLVHHIIVVASDSVQGRKPFTRGETRTVEYLQNQFRSIGLEPGNGKNYLQEVPMVEIKPTAEPQMKVECATGSLDLYRATDYVLLLKIRILSLLWTKASSFLRAMA